MLPCGYFCASFGSDNLGTNPIPHLDVATGLARTVAADQRTSAQDASLALSAGLIDEIKQADTVPLGLPLYNFGPPSTVKAWVDHLIAPACPSTPR
jgi:FMN-dependent NADH-azoreductase